MKRLFAFDLDGTISVSNRRIPSDTLASVDELRSQGNLVVFVTGRRQVDMLPMRDQVSHADYLALNNGAYVYRAGSQDNPLVHARVAPHDARILIGESLAADLILDVITDAEWYATRITEADRTYAEKIGHAPRLFSRVSEIDLTAIEGFMISHAVAEMRRIIERHGLALQCVESEPNCADIMDAGVGKWPALELICRAEGIDAAHVVAVGNYTNDIEMLERAGTGVAVADALPEVRAVADAVLTSRHDENPVAELMGRISSAET